MFLKLGLKSVQIAIFTFTDLQILGDATPEAQSVQEVVTLVEAKEGKRDAIVHLQEQRETQAARNLAANAASSTGLPHRPREKKCRCGNASNFAERTNGG